MTIDDVFKLYRFIVNTAQSGKVTPEQFNLSAERAQLEWYNNQYGDPAEYQPGRPIAVRATQSTQKITDNLKAFLKRSTLAVDSDGKVSYPDGSTVKDMVDGSTLPAYDHISSVRFSFVKQVKKVCGDVVTTTKEKPLPMIDDEDLGGFLNSEIVYPDKKKPIGAFYDDFMQFYPKDLGRIIFTYYRKPTAPKWAYTKDNNGRPVYDAANSVDFEAPDVEHMNILALMCDYASINMREGDLANWVRQAKMEGK